MDIEQVRDIVRTSHCKTAAMERLGITLNGRGTKKFDQLVVQYELNVEHFDTHAKTRKYERISKICPGCLKTFATLKGFPREKVVCSHACANTYFRSGENNPNRQRRNERIDRGELTYAETCWLHHKRECIICGETLVVEAHHYNEDHSDNRPENFVPLCPTHHQYWHSRYRNVVEDKVREYVEKFIGV